MSILIICSLILMLLMGQIVSTILAADFIEEAFGFNKIISFIIGFFTRPLLIVCIFFYVPFKLVKDFLKK